MFFLANLINLSSISQQGYRMTWRVMSQWDTQKMWKYNIYITYHFAVTFLVLFGVFRQNTFEKHEKSGQIHPFGSSNQFWTFGFVSITVGLLLSDFGYFKKHPCRRFWRPSFKTDLLHIGLNLLLVLKILKIPQKCLKKLKISSESKVF